MEEAKSKKIEAHQVLAMVLMFAVSALTILVLAPSRASAGYFELSLGGSYSRSQYSEDSYSWSRRWSASVGYYFTETSGLEVSFTESFERTNLVNWQDTSTQDRVYSLNWIQSFMARHFPVQPYLKAGVGQLNREASGSYAFGVSPPEILDSITAVFAVGLKIKITQNFAFRVEGSTLLSGGRIYTWQDNLSGNFGLSYYF